MERRELLGAVGAGAAIGLSGCLGRDPVVEVQESTRIPPHRGWVQKVEGVDGSGSITYEIKSEDRRFRTFYFTDVEDFQYYQNHTLGSNSTGSSENNAEMPRGHQDLSKIAVEENGVYRAAVPEDQDGRYSMDIEGTHYFIVDYSNYGIGVNVPNSADPIQVTISFQVVSGFF